MGLLISFIEVLLNLKLTARPQIIILMEITTQIGFDIGPGKEERGYYKDETPNDYMNKGRKSYPSVVRRELVIAIISCIEVVTIAVIIHRFV